MTASRYSVACSVHSSKLCVLSAYICARQLSYASSRLKLEKHGASLCLLVIFTWEETVHVQVQPKRMQLHVPRTKICAEGGTWPYGSTQVGPGKSYVLSFTCYVWLLLARIGKLQSSLAASK